MKTSETRLRNDIRLGWIAKTTIKDLNGYDWEIVTMKRNSGGVKCTAQAGTSIDLGGYSTFTYTVFQDPNVTLELLEGRATKQKIELTHLNGLKELNERLAINKFPHNKITTT